ncbi:hypothetical protein QOT17_011908 [Balamuthia mandrillaris]
MSSSMHGWWEIEYSPSDRSLCKNCSATIHVGTARVRERSRRRNSRGAGGVSSRTFHIACFIPKARNNVVAVYWHDFKGGGLTAYFVFVFVSSCYTWKASFVFSQKTGRNSSNDLLIFCVGYLSWSFGPTPSVNVPPLR